MRLKDTIIYNIPRYFIQQTETNIEEWISIVEKWRQSFDIVTNGARIICCQKQWQS